MLSAVIGRLAPRVRYPYLFLALLVLFVVDLLLADPIPFVDEAMLGLLTFLLGSWRTRRRPEQQGGPTQTPPPAGGESTPQG